MQIPPGAKHQVPTFREGVGWPLEAVVSASCTLRPSPNQDLQGAQFLSSVQGADTLGSFQPLVYSLNICLLGFSNALTGPYPCYFGVGLIITTHPPPWTRREEAPKPRPHG